MKGSQEMVEMEKLSLTKGNRIFTEDEEKKYKVTSCKKVVEKVKKITLNNLLLLLTLLGVGFGFVIGFGTREGHPTESALMWIGLPGQLYLRLLKMMIVPLIACSVICGAAALDPKANGKISLIAFVFVVSTNALGSALGIGLVYLFRPGKESIRKDKSEVEVLMETQDVFADLFRNIIPENLFESSFSGTQTMFQTKEIVRRINSTDGIRNETIKETFKYLGKTNNPNIIGLIFACTMLGLAAARLKEKGRPFLDFVQSASDTVVAVVRWFMWTTPIGVISLIAVSVVGVASVEDVFSQLGLFSAAITVGVAFQQLILMCGIFFVFTRNNPYKFLITIARPWMIAFAATSTAVAIPEMLAACEDKNKIDKRISRFVIPFSVTISCNGGALYISAAAIFVSNLTGTPLTTGDVLMLWLLVTVAAMAIPSVPSASIMTVIMILTSMNIPLDDIALLMTAEWFLDRVRITSSVVSHTFCTAVVWSLCKKDLQDIDQKHACRITCDAILELEDTKAEVTVLNGKIVNGQIHSLESCS